MCVHVLSCFNCIWHFVTLLTVSPPGSFIHGILQIRILEWVARPSSRGSSQPRDQTHSSYVSCIGIWSFYHEHHLGNPLKKIFTIKIDLCFKIGFPGGSVVKNPLANAGVMGSIPWWGRYPRGGSGNSLQYSCLENPRDRGVWQVTAHSITKSQTHTHTSHALKQILLFRLDCLEILTNIVKQFLHSDYHVAMEEKVPKITQPNEAHLYKGILHSYWHHCY